MAGVLSLQVCELQEANRALVAELESRDREIQSLRDLADAQSEYQTADVQTAKILDLAKKNRNLNLALERERQRIIKMQQELTAASSRRSPENGGALDSEKLEAVARSMVEQAADAAEAAHKELAALKDKLQQTTNKLCQAEQKAFALEAENKKLGRALIREVGDDIPLTKILDDSSDWKGRREQLIALKDQVRQLKAAQGLVAESRAEALNKHKIREKAAERNAGVDRLASDLAAARQEMEALRLKHDGAQSRKKILEGEVQNLKEKLAVVLEKTKNDDKLIAALKLEIGNRRKSTSNAVETTDSSAWSEVGMLRQKCSEQEAAISRQQQIILALQAKLPASGWEGQA